MIRPTVQEHVSLTPFNTLGFNAQARYMICAQNEQDILFARDFAKEKNLPLLLLGGGSNVVFTQNYEGVVLRVELTGKTCKRLDDNTYEVTCRAGENWHEFVCWALAQDAQGLENLSLIPGTVGAAPVQNIGAYGTDINDWLVSLAAIDLSSGQKVTFTRAECEFSYRDSFFKRTYPQRFAIIELTFHLNTKEYAKLNLNYGGLTSMLEAKGLDVKNVTPLDVSRVVSEVRRAKLPDPQELGNAGSFFKNPIVTSAQLEQLLTTYPQLPHWPHEQGAKISAAWLIQQCGLKGYRQGDAAVHAHHALILVNHGLATGAELWQLAQAVQSQVFSESGVQLEPEPQVLR